MKTFSTLIVLVLLNNVALSQPWLNKNDRKEMMLKGQVRSMTENRYKVINVNGSIKNGDRISSKSYTFSSSGKLIENIEYEKDGTYDYKTKYGYDAGGKLLERISYDDNNQIKGRVKYDYDGFGNVKSSNEGTTYIHNKNPLGEMTIEQIQDNGYRSIYRYNPKGSELYYVLTKDSDSSNNFTKKYDKFERLIEWVEYNFANHSIHFRQVFHYDMNGNKIEMISYYGDGRLNWYAQYKYDFNKNIIENKSYNDNRSLLVTYTWRYVYDKNQNWVERYVYSDGKPDSFEERKISYY